MADRREKAQSDKDMLEETSHNTLYHLSSSHLRFVTSDEPDIYSDKDLRRALPPAAVCFFDMLTRDQAGSIFDKLKKYASADEIELLVSSGRGALTRFANNTIHQNMTEEESHLSVRVSFD